MYTRYYLLHYVILAYSCRISTCDNEIGNSLITLTDCLKGTPGLSDLQLWIYCRERTETAVSRSDRLTHSSEHDYSGLLVPNSAQIGFKIKSSVSVKDGLLLTKHEGTELSPLDFEESRCGEQDKELCFREETAANLARMQKADPEFGSPELNRSEKPLIRISDGIGPHSATQKEEDAAHAITASTSAVLLSVIFFLVTVWLTQSGAARDSLPKTEQEKGAHKLGTVADIHRSHMASSLGRAIALVMMTLFDPKKSGGNESTSEGRPEYLAEMLRDACEEVLLPVLGCEESCRFAEELYGAFREVQLVHSRLETFSNPVTGGGGHQGPSPPGGSAGTQPYQPRRETSGAGQSRGESVATNNGITHTPAAVREGEGEGESGVESLSIESAHFGRHRFESSDGEPPEEWIREQRLRFFDKRQNRGRCCEEGGGASHRIAEGDGDPIHALLPVATRQVALTHAAGRVREGKADKEDGSSSVLERLAAAYETRNHLTVAKLRLGSRQLDVQSQQLEVASENISLMRSSVGIGRRRNELKERAASEQRAGKALRALIAQLADELVTGLWVMVAALVAAGWWLAKDRLREEAAVCYRNVQTPRGWFRFWTSQWMNDLSCQLLIFGRLVFGLAILVLFSSYLVHKDVADMQRRPVFMIIFVMGVLGGYVGNSTVESVGGVGIRWLLCWEALCAFHVAGVWYPKQIYFFVNRCHPEQSGALECYEDERRQELLSTKVRKVAIHALIVLVLPLAAGLWPFL